MIHVMPYTMYSQKRQEDFMSQCFKKEAYSGMIQQIPDKVIWPEVYGDKGLPSLVRRTLGRRKMNRIREPNEVPPEKRRYKMYCKYCCLFGHNKRACQVNPANVNKKTRYCKPTMSQQQEHPRLTLVTQMLNLFNFFKIFSKIILWFNYDLNVIFTCL